MEEQKSEQRKQANEITACERKQCAHYLDRLQVPLYKNKFSLILLLATVAVVILFSIVCWSYNKHQESIVNNYKEYKQEIDSINRTLKCDSTYTIKQQNVLMRLEYQQNSILHQLELQSDKISSDFAVLSIWSGVLMLVFLIFSIYSVFKTDELMRQSRADIDKIEENSDKADKIMSSIQKQVQESISKINEEACKESNDLKLKAKNTIDQIKDEVDKAIKDKTSDFEKKCSEYMEQLAKMKETFSLISKLFEKNESDSSDDMDGQEEKP